MTNVSVTNVSVEISTADLVHLDITKSVEAVLSSKWCVVSGVCVCVCVRACMKY